MVDSRRICAGRIFRIWRAFGCLIRGIHSFSVKIIENSTEKESTVMNKWKRVLAMTIATALSIGALVGCANQGTKNTGASAEVTDNFNATGYPIVKEPITLKMMGVINPQYLKWEENEFFKRMEEKTNIHFEFSTFANDAWAEKKSLAFASGDLPDVFFKASITAKEEITYGADGQLVALEGLIDQYAPNLKTIFNERPTVKKNITTPDGHIYTLPNVNSGRNNAMFYINKKWMDELSLQEPNTVDDLYNILKAFKERDPGCIPMNVMGTDQLCRLLASYGLLFNENNIFAEDGKVVYSPIDERYKKGVTFLKKLYQGGLLDSEVFTQTKQQQTAKGSTGRIGFTYAASPMQVVGEKYHFDYLAITPLVEKEGDERISRGSSETLRGTFAITNKNKYPAESIRWIDYLFSEEGGIMATAGVENVDYKWNEDGTWDYILGEGEETSTDHLAKISAQGVAWFPGFAPDEFMSKINDPFEKVLWPMRERVYPYEKEIYPQNYFSVEDQVRISSLTADMNPYVTQSMAQFITGDLDIEQEWDNYVNTLKRMGVDELIELYQKGYDDFNSED